MSKKIIVIGAGGAGLTAAIAARMAGAEVTVISKTAMGTGTCTAYAGGIFTLGYGNVTPERHSSKTMKTGRNVNDIRLVQTFSEKALQSMKTLQSWGITLKLDDSGHASVRASASNPFMAGYGMVQELYRTGRDKGVSFLDETVVTKLKINQGKVSGVECINWKTGRTFGLGASGVILATGGAGQIYNRTDNPSRITGDGYSLALRAGATLRDMEFVQFYPLGWNEESFTNWMIDLQIIDKVPLTDERDNEFLLEAIRSWGLKDGLEANYYARDRASIFMAKHLKKGGKALLHLEKFPPEKWGRPPLAEMRPFYPANVDPWEYGPVNVSPIEHYMTGGLEIDTSCCTDIEGLFACGEVTGGVDGASRIGGNALTNIVAFGLIAGETVISKTGETSPDFEPSRTDEMISNMKKGRISPTEIKKNIKKAVQKGLGPVRTALSIRETLDSLQELEQQSSELSFENSLELLAALEVRGMLDSAEAVSRAALAREESRGVHFREDFPVERKEWEKNLRLKMVDHEIRVIDR